jgi:hypothetical protein
MSVELFQAEPDGEDLRIGIVQSRFNEPVCTALREACLAELARLGVGDDDIVLCSVPGALEIPGAIALAHETGLYHGYVALGCVLRKPPPPSCSLKGARCALPCRQRPARISTTCCCVKVAPPSSS